MGTAPKGWDSKRSAEKMGTSPKGWDSKRSAEKMGTAPKGWDSKRSADNLPPHGDFLICFGLARIPVRPGG
ncbi:MAG: hypothetical protein CVU57_07495 [Deltaproteobacteria bacterium HGW-Deltaproteobacteria-15]|nr:MAG: hypothetical protein CVU57_07495 [Deltaproteobacteria bacterium HGW-Deltaproteobacteria-15]